MRKDEETTKDVSIKGTFFQSQAYKIRLTFVFVLAKKKISWKRALMAGIDPVSIVYVMILLIMEEVCLLVASLRCWKSYRMI